MISSITSLSTPHQQSPPETDRRGGGGGGITPGPTDILFGRGCSRHPGNAAFRAVVRLRRAEYASLDSATKSELVGAVADAVSRMDPPGRFLESNGDGTWRDAGRRKALEKTRKALQERRDDGSWREPDDAELAEAVERFENAIAETMGGGRSARERPAEATNVAVSGAPPARRAEPAATRNVAPEAWPPAPVEYADEVPTPISAAPLRSPFPSRCTEAAPKIAPESRSSSATESTESSGAVGGAGSDPRDDGASSSASAGGRVRGRPPPGSLPRDIPTTLSMLSAPGGSSPRPIRQARRTKTAMRTGENPSAEAERTDRSVTATVGAATPAVSVASPPPTRHPGPVGSSSPKRLVPDAPAGGAIPAKKRARHVAFRPVPEATAVWRKDGGCGEDGAPKQAPPYLRQARASSLLNFFQNIPTTLSGVTPQMLGSSASASAPDQDDGWKVGPDLKRMHSAPPAIDGNDMSRMAPQLLRAASAPVKDDKRKERPDPEKLNYAPSATDGDNLSGMAPQLLRSASALIEDDEWKEQPDLKRMNSAPPTIDGDDDDSRRRRSSLWLPLSDSEMRALVEDVAATTAGRGGALDDAVHLGEAPLVSTTLGETTTRRRSSIFSFLRPDPIGQPGGFAYDKEDPASGGQRRRSSIFSILWSPQADPSKGSAPKELLRAPGHRRGSSI